MVRFWEWRRKKQKALDEVEKTEKDEEGSFAELFEQSSQAPNSRFSPGDRVTGKVVKIGQDTIFVDLGGKSEGLVEAQEFRDENGQLTIKEGDEVELRISSFRGGIHLSKGIKVHGAERCPGAAGGLPESNPRRGEGGGSK